MFQRKKGKEKKHRPLLDDRDIFKKTDTIAFPISNQKSIYSVFIYPYLHLLQVVISNMPPKMIFAVCDKGCRLVCNMDFSSVDRNQKRKIFRLIGAVLTVLANGAAT